MTEIFKIALPIPVEVKVREVTQGCIELDVDGIIVRFRSESGSPIRMFVPAGVKK